MLHYNHKTIYNRRMPVCVSVRERERERVRVYAVVRTCMCVRARPERERRRGDMIRVTSQAFRHLCVTHACNRKHGAVRVSTCLVTKRRSRVKL